jgi:integrase
MQALTGDEPERFLQAIRGTRLEALYAVAVTAGLRQGELLVLRWRDVDLDRGMLAVSGSLQRDGEGAWHIGSTKTDRSRVVEVAALAVTALREHRAHQHEERLLAGSRWNATDLVFCSEFGKHLNPVTLNRILHRILEAAELPPIRFHDLRHTAATRLLERGVHPNVASEMLGHASVSVTLDIYSKVTPTIQREAIRLAWPG